MMNKIMAELFAESFKMGTSSFYSQFFVDEKSGNGIHYNCDGGTFCCCQHTGVDTAKDDDGVISAGMASKKILKISEGLRFTACFGQFSFCVKRELLPLIQT